MVVSAILFTGCSEDNGAAGNLGSLVLSNTYATIPEAGGSTTITIKATGDWKIENVIKNENGEFKLVDEKGNESNAWFTLSQLSGSAGDTELTITADEVDGGRETEIRIGIGEYTKQFFMIRQGSLEAQSATCADVIAGADGKTYRVKGVCTSIANTTYGNWYLSDGTSDVDVYIYGTLDADGKEKNFSSLNIEVGDSVELEGPKTTYNGTVELVNVTVIEIVKSLAKIVSPEVTLPKEGGELEVKVAYKGSGAYFSIPEEYKGWIANSSSEYIAGIPTKVEQNPADTMVFKFNVAPNDLGARTGSITFMSNKGESSSTLTYSFTQEGSILQVSVAEFNAAEVGETIYRLSGIVSDIKDEKNGQFYLKDYSGETYIYNLSAFKDSDIKVGDIVTVTGKRDEYKETIEMTSAELEEVKHVTDISIADFLNQEDNPDVYYRVSGEVESIANEIYGNLYLTDGVNKFYVYGCYGYGARSDDTRYFLSKMGIKVGDKLTVIGAKCTYGSTIEIVNAIYYSHESAE